MSNTTDAPSQAVPIEADRISDQDSTLGDDESTYTESLRSSLLHSVKENGRGYHKYRDGTYILPEDEREQERLDMQHQMLLDLFGQKLILAPMQRKPLHALDLGTGTGIWAIEYADENPECQVLGIDLSPIQPAFVPPNCKFEVDDWESEWTFKQKFDIIHARMMVGSMADPQGLLKKAFDSTAPGGWFEFQDLYMPILCDDGTMPKDCAWQRWNDIFGASVAKLGRDFRWAAKYKEWMEQTGYTNVTELRFKIPVNTWPKDKFMKRMGEWNLINMIEGLEGYTMRLFITVSGMSPEEVEVLLMEVRKDLHNKRIHSYWPM